MEDAESGLALTLPDVVTGGVAFAAVFVISADVEFSVDKTDGLEG